jgi:hypothetical protein
MLSNLYIHIFLDKGIFCIMRWAITKSFQFTFQITGTRKGHTEYQLEYMDFPDEGK